MRGITRVESFLTIWLWFRLGIGRHVTLQTISNETQGQKTLLKLLFVQLEICSKIVPRLKRGCKCGIREAALACIVNKLLLVAAIVNILEQIAANRNLCILQKQLVLSTSIHSSRLELTNKVVQFMLIFFEPFRKEKRKKHASLKINFLDWH